MRNQINVPESKVQVRVKTGFQEHRQCLEGGWAGIVTQLLSSPKRHLQIILSVDAEAVLTIPETTCLSFYRLSHLLVLREVK